MGDRGPLLNLCGEVTHKTFSKKDKQWEQLGTGALRNEHFPCLLNMYFMPRTLNSLMYSYKSRYNSPFKKKKATESQLAKIMSKFT